MMLINFHIPHLKDYLHQATLEMYYSMEKKAKKIKKENEPLQESAAVVKVMLHLLKMYHHLTLLYIDSKSFEKLVSHHENVVRSPFPVIIMAMKDCKLQY